MSGFRTIKEVVDAELDGKVRNYQWRKVPTVATAAGLWFDLSMSPGMPLPKYWFDATPLTAKGIYQSDDGGFYHGANVSTSEKYLRSITVQASSATPLPMNALLCDYLLYYPTIDEGSTDEQFMTNTVTLPRYTDGKGVMIFAVLTSTHAGGGSFTVNYTNSDGVAGRISGAVLGASSGVVGNTVGQTTIPYFVPLQAGDSGVRSIESVTMSITDSGLFTLILVKPLVQHCFKETGIPNERDYLIPTSNLPQIYDNAFLNFLVLPQGSLSGVVLTGNLKVIWT